MIKSLCLWNTICIKLGKNCVKVDNVSILYSRIQELKKVLVTTGDNPMTGDEASKMVYEMLKGFDTGDGKFDYPGKGSVII